MTNASLAIAVLAGCATTTSSAPPLATAPTPQPALSPLPAELAAVRARGPAGLADMLVRYDAMTDGPEREAFALAVDRVAGQRYATTSRLYWYTDFATAKAAANASGKPILALRMLGRLDEDLSCANSRLFRATLYSDPAVSQYMTDNFVLFWSSERAVPKVTIDFGDGRKIESTTTGNSAHYVLDAEGGVIDALPGLYAPRAFRAELAAILEHARKLAVAAPSDRDAIRRRYHAGQATAMATLAVQLGDSLAMAQRATVSKAAVEIPVLRSTGRGLADIQPEDIFAWSRLAVQTWPFLSADDLLSPQAIELVTRIHRGSHAVDDGNLPEMLSGLRMGILADSALDQLRLRPQIHAFLQHGETDFTTVNRFVYAKVFHTPDSDPWLGLLPRTAFTGVPGDGVSTAQR